MYKKQSQFTPLLFAFLLFVFGIVIAIFAAQQQHKTNQTELQGLFDQEAKTLVSSVLSYIKTYKYGLLGARGVVVAHGNDSISRQAFKIYSMSRNLDLEFPGARGFGFIRRVARADEAEFLKKARADDMPDFAIKQFAPHNNDRYIIQYLEPAGRNRPAIGLDIASEASRRNAAQQAMQTGTATLTAPVTLVQASGLPLSSFVLFLPVYNLNMPLDSEKQRIAATLGWTFAPMVIDDVLQHTGAITDKQIDLQITDVSVNQNQPPFYSPADFTDLEKIAHQAQFQREIFGRTWKFKLCAEPAFYANHEKLSPVWLASFITTCSFLFAILLYFYLKSQQQLLAKSRQQMHLAAIVESAHDAIISLDLDAVVTSWNNAAYLMFDYTASEAIGRKICDLIIPDEILPQKEAFLSKIKRGEFIPHHDTIRKTRDGRLIDVSVMFSPIFDKDNRVIGTAKNIVDIRQRKDLQSELHVTLARLKMAVKSMNLGIWVWQIKENRLIWDKRMLELYDVPDSISETGVNYDFWHSCTHPDDVDYLDQKLAKFMAGTESYNPEFRIILPNGEIRYLKAAAIIERDFNGQPKQMVGVNFDITNIKTNEQRLLESERRFRELFEYTPIAYQSLNIEGRFIDVNSRFCELLGYSREEILGKSFDEIWLEETKAEFMPSFSKFKNYLKVSNELYLQHKNGQIITVILEGRIQRDSQDQFVRTHCILTDISDRKRAEQALLKLTEELEEKVKERTKELLTLYHQAPCGYHSLDVNGTIIQVNQTELDLLGYSREEYVGHRITEFVTPDSVKVFQKNFPEFCRIGRVRDLEFDFICKDGRILSFLINGDLVRDAQGQALYSTSTMVDNSERKAKAAQIAQLNAELICRADEAEQASRAKTNFLANMSHEIRTPMNAILGLTYLLQKKSLLPEERGMIEKIDLAGRSLLGIINTCLDFSKIESNQLSLENIPFRLTDIFENLANIMCSAAGEKNLELLIAPVPEGADYLSGDAIRLGQVLINLAGNAIKFTEFGEVVVNVQAVDSEINNNEVRLRFSVRDTGVGIPIDKQELIFQAFSQADNSTSRLYGGTGLGLTISRHLVELMGGQLQLRSEMGVGSEFFFELTFTRTEAVKNSIPALPHQTVLIVDDHHTARLLLELTIQSLGWIAHVVDTSEKALQIIAEKGVNHFDFLLIDWQMPNAAGVPTAVEIRTRLGKERCPLIIMMTAYERMVLLEQPAKDIADAILSKPVTSSSLFNAVLDVKIKQGKAVFNLHKPVDGKRLLGITLLVVDDSETNREVAYQILTGEGATVETAENGQNAIVRLMARPDYFQVVLMDVQMPVMDGYTATRQIRATPHFKNLPIIALTAGAFNSQRLSALEAGMDDFIGKPFDVEELIACVERFSKTKHEEKAPVMITPKTVAPTDAINLTLLPLIDVENGLKRWGDAEIYQKYLRLFAEKNHENAVETQQALLDNDVKTAKAITHKLLGSAGNLSLKRLVHVAAKIEACFNNNEKPQEQQLVAFEKTLTETITAINNYLINETTIVSTTEQPALVSCSKKELLQFIQALDTDNPALIEPKLNALTGKLPVQQFDDLENFINNFDFRGAESLANKLLSENVDFHQGDN